MGSESDGATFYKVAIFLEVEALEDFVFILLGSFGFDFDCGVLLAVVGDSEIVADDGAVGVLIDSHAVLGWLIYVAIVLAGGCCCGGIKLLGEHDGDVDGVGFDFLDGHYFEVVFSEGGEGDYKD